MAREGDGADREGLAIERMVLNAPDAYGQSGFHGDARRWEALRRPVVAALDCDGSYLDVGCANGLLLESAIAWAAEAGHRIEPFGLDRSVALAEMALARLKGKGGEIWVGEVTRWHPPRRFDFVRAELVDVPGAARREYVERLRESFLAPGGRLIVAS